MRSLISFALISAVAVMLSTGCAATGLITGPGVGLGSDKLGPSPDGVGSDSDPVQPDDEGRTIARTR